MVFEFEKAYKLFALQNPMSECGLINGFVCEEYHPNHPEHNLKLAVYNALDKSKNGLITYPIDVRVTSSKQQVCELENLEWLKHQVYMPENLDLSKYISELEQIGWKFDGSRLEADTAIRHAILDTYLRLSAHHIFRINNSNKRLFFFEGKQLEILMQELQTAGWTLSDEWNC